MQTKISTQEEYLKRINVVVEYINNHLDSELDLNKLAEISNLSPYHFHRIIKAFLGEPPGLFITRMRVETAARLLRYTKVTIQEVAYSVGYEMPSSLSKAFNQYYGISPTEYRNNKKFVIMKPPLINTELKLKAPKILELPAKKAIYIRLIGEYGNSDYDSVWSRLWAFIKEHKLFTAGIENIGISHDDPNVTESEKCRYDACLVIHKPAQSQGEVGVKEIAGGKYAVFEYQGSYNNLGAVYDTIFGKWLPENGYELRSAPCFEKYMNNPNHTTPEKLKTEIYIPLN
jgi:AraC family transcriptional regulator